jgi:ABC-type multidrug transport system ATPase subunit
MGSSVIIDNLSKSYGRHKALDNLTLNIRKGELFGFIGPDGAGKTTLFRIMTTLLKPDQGAVTVEGNDTVKEYKKIRKMIGYMPGRFSLYQDLSVEENLRFFASIFKTTVEENYHLIADIYKQIEPFKTRPAGKLSGGMKQKLALSCALIHKPEVLFLDEPTTGVDAVSRKEFWDMLHQLRREGITIVVSTPYMDEASRCDRVALIQEGKTMQIDTPGNIARSYPYPLMAIKSDKMYELLFDIQKFPDTLMAYRSGEFIHAAMKQPDMKYPSINEYLESRGHGSITARFIPPSVEDSFMALMQL